VFFDGTSLGELQDTLHNPSLTDVVAYVFGIVVYLTVTIPSLRALGAEEDRDQEMALRVLSAGNIIMIGSLLLILGLQGGQEWARRQEKAVERKEQ